MCCGSKRLDAARHAAPAYVQPVPRPAQGRPLVPAAPALAGAAVPGTPGGAGSSSIASSGTASSRAGSSVLAPSSGGAARAAAAAGSAGPVFVHDGAGELIVTGVKTGRRYRFAGRGARLAVDALDAPALALVDKLRRLG
jgi:hypothetical protein